MLKYLDTSVQLQRLTERELIWCLRFNRVSHKQGPAHVFAVISRLGNGLFWYTLMIALPLAQGTAALPVVGRMLATGGLCLGLYKWLKGSTIRTRPCDCNGSILTTVPPLDQYSFPSGHTLHAVAFSVVIVFYYPQLTWLVVPFTVLVALSRLVLGLHYPSDVLAGALLGAGLAMLVLLF